MFIESTKDPMKLLALSQQSTAFFFMLPPVLRFVIILGINFANTFLLTLFSAALIHHVTHMTQKSMRENIRACKPKMRIITWWALLSWIVELSVTYLAAEASVITGGTILLLIIAIAMISWSFSTVFVLPLIVTTQKGLKDLIATSIDITRKNILEIMGGASWFMLISLLLTSPILILIFTSASFVHQVILFSFLLLCEFVIRTILSTAYNIFKTKLYLQHPQQAAHSTIERPEQPIT